MSNMKIGILISFLIHEYTMTNTLWLVSLYKYIDNDRNNNLEFYIDAL